MCVLRVTSETMSFRDFLKQTELPVYKSYEKGEIRLRTKQLVHDDYGFYCDVSERDWEDMAGQVQDAFEFLKKHENLLRSLLENHSVDDIRLDFPYSCRLGDDIAVQCDYLPPEFLKLAGDIGVGIEMSLYPATEEEDSEQENGADG